MRVAGRQAVAAARRLNDHIPLIRLPADVVDPDAIRHLSFTGRSL